MRIHRSRCGLLAACLLVSTALAAHAIGEPSAGTLLRDGVVVDVPGAVAYVMHPQGGIEALDLQKGTVLWRSSAAERPLALADGLLVAQAPAGARGELRIVTLDVRQRGALTAQAALPMPAGVRAEAAETVNQKFRVTASPSAQGIVLAWDSQELPSLPRRNTARPGIGTKALAAGEEPEARSGTALFEPRAGRLLAMKAKAANSLAIDATRPVIAKSLSAPTAPERLFASADGRYVLASRRVEEITSPAPYLWTISDAETGAVLGTLRSPVSMSPFTVAGTRLVHVAPITSRREGSKLTDQPLRLRAVDLATGQELWTREIRDTNFRGPFPL
ncbi:MAG TPA: hypothetical protein VIC28_00515 [Thermoanaerobaculia bacterium]